MRGWPDLPTRLKSKCISEMSLVTRTRLSMCSSRSEYLVKSVPFNIPRVRFYQKGRDFLLVIYRGIRKFTRLEFRQESWGCRVYRSEDNFNLVKVGYIDKMPYTAAVDTLISIAQIDYFEHIEQRKVKLDVVEVSATNRHELSTLVFAIKEMSFKELVVHGDYYQCQIKQNWTNLHVICGITEKHLLEAANLLPNFVQLSLTDGKFQQLILIYGNPPEEIYKHLQRDCKSVWKRCYGPKLDSTTESVGLDRSKVEGVLTIDSPTCDNFTLSVSKCGVWIEYNAINCTPHVAPPCIKNNCGLEYFCKTHSDPFTFWYYSTVPRRIIDEPYWADGIIIGPNEEEEIQSTEDLELIGNVSTIDPNSVSANPEEIKERPKFTVLEIVDLEKSGNIRDLVIHSIAGVITAVFVLGFVLFLVFM